MVLLDLVLPRRRQAQLNELADQIAGASLEGVSRRVEHRLAELSPAEARGYIRARSAAVVEQKTDALLALRPPKFTARREELICRTREEVVRRVLDRFRESRTHAAPRRRAA